MPIFRCGRIQLLKFSRCCAVVTAKALWGQKSVSIVDDVCVYILPWANLIPFVPLVHGYSHIWCSRDFATLPVVEQTGLGVESFTSFEKNMPPGTVMEPLKNSWNR